MPHSALDRFKVTNPDLDGGVVNEVTLFSNYW